MRAGRPGGAGTAPERHELVEEVAAEQAHEQAAVRVAAERHGAEGGPLNALGPARPCYEHMQAGAREEGARASHEQVGTEAQCGGDKGRGEGCRACAARERC